MQNESFRPERKAWFTILRRNNIWDKPLAEIDNFVDLVWSFRNKEQLIRNHLRHIRTRERFKT